MRKLALFLGLAAVVALGPGGVARAVPPEHFPVEHVDETFTIEGWTWRVQWETRNESSPGRFQTTDIGHPLRSMK